MNKKNKKKLMSFVLAGSIFLTGCKSEIKGVVNKIKDGTQTNIFNIFVPEYTRDVVAVFEETESSAIFSSDEIENTEDLVIQETINITIQETENTENTETQETENTETQETENSQVQEDDDKNNNIIVYANTDLNIRTSNNSNSLVIGNLKMYEGAYKILSCDNNWDLVKVNNKIGFVYRDYLDYSNENYDMQYQYNIKNDIVLTTTNLNFRTEPNGDSKKLSMFSKNTELVVIAEVNNDWLLVKHNGVLGYVNKNYTISLLDIAREQYPDLNLNELDVKKIVYASTDLNIRNYNNKDGEIINSLQHYETVRVLKEYDDWYFIMTNNYNFGFVNKNYTIELDDIFVVVDLNEQKLYMYNNDELYFVTPVTTGKDTTPSDIGLFKIYNKETNRYLVGANYRAFVNYWMPYNRGEGLHDATWRSVFGSQSYKTSGSHGCINLPYDIADDIYNNVSVGTKVLVHK